MTLTNPGARVLDSERIAVVGLGASGTATLDTLASLTTADLGAFDVDESKLDGAPAAARTRASAADNAALAQVVLDFEPSLVVPAPGIGETGPLFAACRRAGIAMASEIELAWRLRACREDGTSAPWLCVTGTNGKTTTVTVLASILAKAGLGGLPIGNVGTPAITETTRTDADAPRAFALELSSFQLRTTPTMSPLASLCLNIADDHLEWHGTFDAYRAAKARIYEHVQTACLYPVGDTMVQSMVDDAEVIEGARAIGLTTGIPNVGQIGIVDGMILDRAFHSRRWNEAIEVANMKDIAHLAPNGELPSHLLADVLGAVGLARACGIDVEQIRRGLRAYKPGEHRIAMVAMKGGAAYIDDSKATNAHAAEACLLGEEDGSVVWIVGGLAKGASFGDLVAHVAAKLAGVIVIGRDQEPWKEALAGLSLPLVYIPPSIDDVMKAAVAEASALAEPGMKVILSPACASMDQFSSYAERGNLFADAVKALP